MDDNWHKHIDLSIKGIAVVVASFSIVKYFADREATQAAEARERSLGFIAIYANPSITEHRKTLNDFWLAHADVRQHVKDVGGSDRAKANFLVVALENYSKADQVLVATYTIANLFDQVAFCARSFLCDEVIVNDYFCSRAKAFYDDQAPLLRLLEGTTEAEVMSDQILELSECGQD